jgi:hypothetical protein
MALSGIFQKTAKGAAELSTRSVKLAPMTRMALVMIDGVKTVPDLAARLGGDTAAEAALGELLSHGLIESKEDMPAGASAANSAGLALAAAKHVSGAMGPMGDDYCLRIERAKTPADLDAAAERARNAIGSFTTHTKADAFWTQYQANRGA